MGKKSKKLKYYIYVSESKVNMLYSQIDKSLLAKLQAEVKFTLRLFDVSFTEKQFDDSLYTKLHIVIEHIKKNYDVGSIGKPQEFFQDTIFMQWARIHRDVLFFGGSLNDTVLGLGGSMIHLLGHRSPKVEVGISHTPWLISVLAEELQMQIRDPELSRQLTLYEEQTTEENNRRVLSAVNSWSSQISKRPVEKFEFLAKRLRHDNYQGKKVLFGTPIYVAIAQ